MRYKKRTGNQPDDTKAPLVSARQKMMDLLARRDHSPVELRRKLAKFEYSEDEIEAALDWARERKFIPFDEASAQAHSEKWRAPLDRRKKGIRWMNQKLSQIGLPKIASDPESELEKALDLVVRKAKSLRKSPPLTREDKAKIQRFLMSRGFESTTINEALKKWASTSPDE